MTKLSTLRTAEDVRVEDLANDHVEEEYIRTALARAVAMRVLAYRVEHGLSQTGLARELGMQQPAIARLEAGDHEPTFSTLVRLARGMGIEFHIDITPDTSGLRETAWCADKTCSSDLIGDLRHAPDMPRNMTHV